MTSHFPSCTQQIPAEGYFPLGSSLALCAATALQHHGSGDSALALHQTRLQGTRPSTVTCSDLRRADNCAPSQ